MRKKEKKICTNYCSNHSDLQYSEDISKFMAIFFKRIVKKRGQKLILGDNFVNKISDDFYILQHFLIGPLKIAKKCEKPPKLRFFTIFGYF